ncbi:MAG TPA: TOPRIM nucleotidyl transferase/hydrolase domain-containing protein [Gaiellaceae bacterium]|nr:TOPRIM nucleotidyl transferase/hydrolase domain-containing protein [Gaiellaceae bacterium]
MSAVVLVEGASDRVALETLARRRGRDLAGEGVSVVAIGGAQAIGRVLDDLMGASLTVAGLCDAGEEQEFRRAFERAGLEAALVHVCVADLEDELIRALGTDAVEAILEANGDLGSFRTLQKQAVWRGRPVEDQLRRFMGSGARRKIRYAALLVEALDLHRAPQPLDGILGRV